MVLKVEKDHAVVQAEGGREAPKRVEIRDLVVWLRLSFAITYYAAQGLGFDRIRLWDCDSGLMSRAALITGLSRCRSASGVDIAPPDPDFDVKPVDWAQHAAAWEEACE